MFFFVTSVTNQSAAQIWDFFCAFFITAWRIVEEKMFL